MNPNIATAPRQHLRIRALRTLNFGLRAANKIGRTVRSSLPAEGPVLVTPAVESVHELADLLNRLSWYLPNFDRPVEVIATPEMMPRNVDLTALISWVPTAQAADFSKLPDVKLLARPSRRTAGYSRILVRRWSRVVPWLLRLRAHQTAIVDPEYFSTTECHNWATLLHGLLDSPERDRLRRLSLANWRKLVEATADLEESYLFTTGPSLDRVSELSFPERSLNIVCNSIVKNHALLERLKPQILVFADPVFHFSPCRYDHEFRAQAVRMLKNHGSYCIVPEAHLALMLRHFPELESCLIGIPTDANFPLAIPDGDAFQVRSTGNILTLFMVPVASALTRKVSVIGADGRQKGEKYFWQHSKQNQFHDLMETVAETHPSFFRDRDYEDYYEKHCETLEALFTLGESKGVRYESLTPSYIPALERRMARS